jgi:bifunctional ADP-heptose synthase (sugar kinase/adenylyltransferase)
MTRFVANVPTQAVVYSDFRHGIFNRRTIPEFVQALPKGAYKVADSQVASRWGNITDFQGFDLITPNEREARFAMADQDSGVRPLASMLYDKARCKLLMLKLGERGMLVCRGVDHESLDSFYVIDSLVDNLVDPVGAGDALLAYSTLSLLVDGDDARASVLGAIAAACECEVDGNAPITADAMHRKIDLVEKHVNFG